MNKNALWKKFNNIKLREFSRDPLNLPNFQFMKFCSKTHKELKQLPYLLGGMKFLNNSRNPFKSFEEFDEGKLLGLNRNVRKELYDVDVSDEENSEVDFNDNKSKSNNSFPRIYFNKNFISALRFNLSYSNDFYKAMNEIYLKYTNNLVQILNRENSSPENNLNAKTSLRKILNEKFYKKLLYEENSFLIKRKENFNSFQKTNKCKNSLTLYKDNKNKNKFYLDKIFLHCNYDENLSENLYLEKIENIHNKNMIIFNHKNKNSLNRDEDQKFSKFLSNFKFSSFVLDENYKQKNWNKKILVRFSVWGKISDNLIIEYKDEIETVHKFRIYDDEWHHILFEMKDDLNELKYLNVLNNFSFPKIVSKLIIGTKNKSNNFEDELKIADFDFYMRGNPISEHKENLKDEFYFIKRRI